MNYKMPELEQIKTLTDNFLKKADSFIEKIKQDDIKKEELKK